MSALDALQAMAQSNDQAPLDRDARGVAIRVEKLSMAYPGAEAFLALNEVSLEIRENEFFTLLGPSGCGKTTLLRLIAGFEQPSAGDLKLDEVSLVGKPPNRRPINTVFQSYALFPHMSVAQNIAFGLEMRGEPRARIKETVARMLDLVKLSDFGQRKPQQLSGGQQQRVALARALATHPRVLLLDESLSALDFQLRKEMQFELKRLQRETGITFVFVTHDQEEALTMSDRIAVMRAGVLQQVGTPTEIYDRPANRFVAGFIGETNLLIAEGDGSHLDFGAAGRIASPHREWLGRLTIAIRPERLGLVEPDQRHDGLAGVVEDIVYLGNDTTYIIQLQGQGICRVRQQNDHGADDLWLRGDQVTVRCQPAALRRLDD